MTKPYIFFILLEIICSCIHTSFITSLIIIYVYHEIVLFPFGFIIQYIKKIPSYFTLQLNLKWNTLIMQKEFFCFCVFRISSKMRNFISVPVWTCSQKLNKMVYGFTSCYYFSFVRKMTCKILVNEFEKLLFYTISHNHKKFWW